MNELWYNFSVTKEEGLNSIKIVMTILVTFFSPLSYSAVYEIISESEVKQGGVPFTLTCDLDKKTGKPDEVVSFNASYSGIGDIFKVNYFTLGQFGELVLHESMGRVVNREGKRTFFSLPREMDSSGSPGYADFSGKPKVVWPLKPGTQTGPTYSKNCLYRPQTYSNPSNAIAGATEVDPSAQLQSFSCSEGEFHGKSGTLTIDLAPNNAKPHVIHIKFYNGRKNVFYTLHTQSFDSMMGSISIRAVNADAKNQMATIVATGTGTKRIVTVNFLGSSSILSSCADNAGRFLRPEY